MFRFLAFVLIGFTSTASLLAASLPGEPPIRSFSMAEYNSNVQNWGAAMGPDGLIYVGGGMGLLEYDGVRWTRHDTPNNSRVRVMHIQAFDDAPTRFWIGSTNQFGYFQRDATGTMQYHSISDQLPENQRIFGDVRDIIEVNDAIYFHAIPALFRWDGETLRQRPNWDGIFRLLTAADDRALVIVGRRLHDVTGLDWSKDEPPPPIERWRWDSLGERGQRLTFLQPWPDGRMLFGTYDQGLFWLSDDNDNAPIPFLIAPGTDIDITTAWPYIVHRRDDGTILLATRHAGLLHLAADGRLIEHVSSNNGLPMDVINGLAEDRQGGAWLPQQGVITRVGLGAPGVEKTMRSWGKNAELSNARGMAVHNGQIILAVNSGLVRLDAAGTDAARAVPLESSMIEAWDVLSTDGELFAAGSEGIHRLSYEPATGALLNAELVLVDHYGYRLTPSHHRPVIYAEIESGLGLLVQNDAGRWIADPRLDSGRVPGIDQRIHHVAETPDGRIWAGTVQGRFYVLEWQDDALTVVAELGADEGVPEGYAWPFMLGNGNDGRLVLGTFDGGYRPVIDEAGNVVGVEPDPGFDRDNLGDNASIFKMASPDGQRVLAGIGEGGALRFGWMDEDGAFNWQPHPVPGIEIGQNDFILADDDGAWIGRAPGLVRLNWPDREAASLMPPVFITRAGYPDTPDNPNCLLGGPGVTSSLSDERLPFQTGSLRFEYALAEFNAPESHQYRVRLEGLDRDWSNWSEETRRDYTNLPGGDYQFQVQARDAHGRVSDAEPIRFSIAPPWYLGTPMLAVYAAIALLLLWLAASFGRARRERQLATRQRELEREVAERTREVRNQARQIRDISDARASFFANVSHELRTPLTLTRAPLEELARDDGQMSTIQREHLQMALRNTEAMQGLIGQVLDLHRLDADRMPLNPVRADLTAAVSSIIQRFQLQAKQQQIQLTTRGLDAPVAAPFDPEHLATMLTNLLSNALKFSPRDSEILIELQADAQGYSLVVSDQGPGIDPTDQARIFERYQQAANTKTGGTGIGLALVRELAELHEGTVQLNSTPGQGARFEIWLPEKPDIQTEANQTAEPATDLIEPAQAMTKPTEPGDRPSVLLVEDNAELRSFLRFRLGPSYQIHEASDGEAGLIAARKHVPDVIVTDGMMPNMDGLTMASELKADPETDFIPILMLTARGGSDAVIRGMQAGADDYLAKPFDSAELAARIAGLIASRRRLRERLSAEAKQEFEQPTENTQDPFIAKARTILADHLSEPGFSVRDWADLLHMDRTTLFRKFKAATDQSPDQALRQARLELAAKLLRQKAGNVAEVADAVGFASVSAFSRRFRDQYNQSPANFARNAN